MRGAWLARIGRALVSPETFEQMVAPSIADLQIESGRGFALQWQHYVGVVAVLSYALVQDLRFEISFTCDAGARRHVWKRAAIWYSGFVLLLSLLGLKYKLPQGLRLHGLWGPSLTSVGLEAIIVSAIPGMMAAALYLTRRSCSKRSIVLVTVLVTTLITAFALTVRPIRMSADNTLLNAALSQSITRAQYFSDRLDTQVNLWRDIQTGIQIIPFALLGILLSRRKGWNVALGVAAYYASWLLIVILFARRLDSPPSRVTQGWREIGLNFAALLLVYVVDFVPRRLDLMRSRSTGS